MRIKVFNDVIEIKNEQSQIEEVFEKISKKITDMGLNLGRIKINGIEFQENYSQYIMDNLNIIEIIEIDLKTNKEIIDDYLKSTTSYLEGLLPELELLVDDIYIDFTKDLWGKFSDFFEGLESIITILDMLCQNGKLYPNIDKCVFIKEKLSGQIKNLSEAFEIEDRVLISDLIIYEIKVTLEDLYNEINTSLYTN